MSNGIESGNDAGTRVSYRADKTREDWNKRGIDVPNVRDHC
jgi:hypothetical protein